MSKEDLMKYREEQDRKETKKMFDAIHKNHQQVVEKRRNQKLLQAQVLKIQKEKEAKRNFIEIVIVFMILLILSVVMMIGLAKSNEEFMEKCTAAGDSISYCRSQL